MKPETSPASTAQGLRWVADYLDEVDRFLERAGVRPGKHTQSDLRLWAEWLEDHPEVDETMFRFSHAADVTGWP